MGPRLRWLTVAFLLGVPLGALRSEPGQEIDPQIKKILADWGKRQERIKVVRYRVEGTITFPKESLSSGPGTK
jgi:hypothetical protein